MIRVLITEANDGLGLALVKEYLADADNQVVAFCGDPMKRADLDALKTTHDTQLLIVDVNLADEESIKASVEPIEGFVDALDLLILDHGYIPDFFLKWDMPSGHREDVGLFYKQLDYVPRWLYNALNVLLEQGTQSKFLGMDLYFRGLWTSAVFPLSKNLGKTMTYSNFYFRAIAKKVDPAVVSIIDLDHYDLTEVIESDTLDTMNLTELVDQDAVNLRARALFDNIPRLPHGKHYYQKTIHA